MHTRKIHLNRWQQVLLVLGVAAVAFIAWETFKRPQTIADWQTPLAVLSTAEFNDNLVTVRNIRNFRYEGSEGEADLRPAYYDRTYDLNTLTRVWYITEPFGQTPLAAHTFLSFEFSTGDFLTISIEARKKKGQEYGLIKGLLRTYPLMYIAADERDALLVRANIRKDEVYLYPVRTTPQKGRELLVDVLKEMNHLVAEPQWYNTIAANCTSLIAIHVNRISPGRMPSTYIWQAWITGYADAFALENGFLDTDLPLDQAREKYNVSARSREIGDVEDYSTRIREGL